MAFNSAWRRAARRCPSASGAVVQVFCLMALSLAAVSCTKAAFAMAHPAGAGLHSAIGQGYLGIDIRTVTDPSVSGLRLRENHGAVIITVDHDGPAWKAGLREHDVVQSVNGSNVDSEEQLRRVLREMQPGRAVQIGISRDGSTQTLSATMANRDEIGRRAWEQHYVVPAPSDSEAQNTAAAPPAKASHYFGHSLMPNHILPVFPSYTGAVVDEIGPQLSDYFGLKGGKGLLVHSVEANSPAASAGLHAGDVVLRVNGQVMESHSDWNRALHDSKGHTVPVVVMRDHHEQTLTMVPDSKRRSSVVQPATQVRPEPKWLAVMLFH